MTNYTRLWSLKQHSLGRGAGHRRPETWRSGPRSASQCSSEHKRVKLRLGRWCVWSRAHAENRCDHVWNKSDNSTTLWPFLCLTQLLGDSRNQFSVKLFMCSSLAVVREAWGDYFVFELSENFTAVVFVGKVFLVKMVNTAYFSGAANFVRVWIRIRARRVCRGLKWCL